MWPRMTRSIALIAVAFAVAAPASAQFCAEQSISWTEETGAKHTTVVEGRIRNGCPMVRQSIAMPGTSPLEATGPDCDCDLVIDGEEARFSAPLPIVAGRMLDVCLQNRASARPNRNQAEMSTVPSAG